MSKIKIFGLGGLNENGKNMYVASVDDSIFVFEAGLQYADEHTLGIDYVIPNIDYLKNNGGQLHKVSNGHILSNDSGEHCYSFELEAELYLSDDEDIMRVQNECLELMYDYNLTRPSEKEKRQALLLFQ